MKLRHLTTIGLCGLAIAALTGCESMQGNEGAVIGGVSGAALGAVAGGAIGGEKNREGGVIIGGLLGGAAGAAAGNQYDKSKTPAK